MELGINAVCCQNNETVSLLETQEEIYTVIKKKFSLHRIYICSPKRTSIQTPPSPLL